MKQNKIYLYYNNKADINYSYLFLLYSIAEYNKTKKCYNIIKYKSIEDLTKRLNANFGDNNISKSTVNRMLNCENYKAYFKHYKNQKQIELLNDIRNDKSNFIVLSKTATEFLILSNDNLLSKYYLYLVYYCGISKNKKTDSTAKQILEKIGYSKSGNNITKVANYNQTLTAIGLIKIEKYKDNCGYWRNLYSILN